MNINPAITKLKIIVNTANMSFLDNSGKNSPIFNIVMIAVTKNQQIEYNVAFMAIYPCITAIEQTIKA